MGSNGGTTGVRLAAVLHLRLYGGDDAGAALRGKLILIPNPRDMVAVLAELAKHKNHMFPSVNTLFNGLANHPDFNKVDWSSLVVSTGGGTAVQSTVAKLWFEKTGCAISKGYGLSETSPIATSNPATATEYSGSIGVPISSTWRVPR